jgi:hypothetical protein
MVESLVRAGLGKDAGGGRPRSGTPISNDDQANIKHWQQLLDCAEDGQTPRRSNVMAMIDGLVDHLPL